MKIERYQPYYYPIIATRGCPESCSFCFAKRVTSGFRTHPIRYVIEQVRRRPSWVKGMYFVDDNLAGDLDYAHELFAELAKYRVPFGMQVRHEFSKDPRNLHLAREAGCMLVSSGYESVNQSSLDRTGKRATATGYKEIIGNIQRAGMIASGNWMFGFDWDTPEIFEETWEFLRESEIIHSSFTVEIPFPGTPGYRRYEREGRLISTDYDDYIGKDHVVHRPKNMSAEQLRDGIRWLTLKYYSLSHRTRLMRAAMQNRAFLSEYDSATRTAAIAFLNYYQVWLWRSRMMPSLRNLYARLMPYNGWRYVSDVFRGTNFWSSPHGFDTNRSPTITTQSAFVDGAGEMPPGKRRLRLATAPPAAARWQSRATDPNL